MPLTLQEPTAARNANGRGRRLKILFVVEGCTDIRFVVGLSQTCDLTILVPSRQYVESGLEQRIPRSGARVGVDELHGGRLQYQVECFRYLLKKARDFDVILSQEVLRGSLNANLVGTLRGVPVVTYMGIAPVEYFRCRRKRKEIGWAKALLGEAVIRTLMTINGGLATRCLAMGPYLRDIAARYCSRSEVGLYYGVDTDYLRPTHPQERTELRRKLALPVDKFVIFLSSRISHEKDPETVLRATAIARSRGLDAVLINLGGGYKEFLALGARLQLRDRECWVLGRPAADPMSELADYFRAADVLAQASLAEGAAFSTLEGLSCGTPVVATAVGGMAVQLKGYARLVPHCDPEAMAEQFLWVSANREKARAQALQGRDYVVREWNQKKAFSDLLEVLARVMEEKRPTSSRGKQNAN